MASDLASILGALAPDERDRLHACGYRTRRDLAGASFADIVEDTRVPEEKLRGVLRQLRGPAPGTGKARAVDANGRPSAAAAGQTAEQLLLLEAGNQPCVVTFCRELDDLLGGGVHVGRLTELTGGTGSGKTQLVLQAALDVQIPPSFGGLGGSAVVVDTDGSVTGKRLHEMAQHLLHHLRAHQRANPALARDLAGMSAAGLVADIHVIRVFTLQELLALVTALPGLLLDHARRTDPSAAGGGQPAALLLGLPAPPLALRLAPSKPVRLVAIDSIASPFRAAALLATKDASVKRQQQLSLLGQRLRKIADRFDLAVLVTNQLTLRWTKTESSARDSQSTNAVVLTHTHEHAALGNMWGHEVADRVLLAVDASGPGMRIASIEKSADLPQGSAVFRISSRGVRGRNA